MGDKNTVGLKVYDFGLMMELLQQDFDSKIFLREYVQNSLEAIQNTPSGKGTIIIDWDTVEFEKSLEKNNPVYKIRITDNGVGMDEEALNKMSDLFREKTINDYQNYGIGAKISGLDRSPIGIVYTSWVDNVGRSLILHMNERKPGIQTQLDDENNPQTVLNGYKKNNVPKVRSKWRNEVCLIQDHGTSVTLLGKHSEDNTYDNPNPHEKINVNWIPKYLNSRYYVMPQKVYFCSSRRKEKNSPMMRDTILGQKHFLDINKKSSGTLNLKFEDKQYDAKVNWWILQQNKKQAGHYPVTGGTSILFENELYYILNSKSTKRMEMFGVIEDYSHIHIIVEPESYTGFKAHMSRCELRRTLSKDERKLMPWEIWGKEFEKNMPIELHDHIQEKINKRIKNTSSFVSAAIQDFEKRMKGLEAKIDAILHSKGKETDNVSEGDNVTHGNYHGESENPRPNPPKPDPVPPNPSNSLLVKPGAERKKTLPFKNKTIKFEWIENKEEWLDGKIADYSEKANKIRGNKCYHIFEKNLKLVLENGSFKKITTSQSLLRKAYYDTIEYKMVVAMQYAKQFKRELGIENFKNLTSNEALLLTSTPDDAFINLMMDFCQQGKKNQENENKEADAVVNTQEKQETKQVDYTPHIEHIEQRV